MSFPPSGYAAPQHGYPYPPPPPPPLAAPPAPSPAMGLAVAALVVAILALLGVVGLGVWAVGHGADTSGGSADDRGYPLTGQLAAPHDGGVHPTPGDDVARSVTEVIEATGGRVNNLDCPAVLPRTGVVSVCHGTVDDEDWAVVVFFEDNDGRYTLNLI